jgi:CheY-like chemotaxis protein
MPLFESSRPTSILLIEPNGGLAMKLQDLLVGHLNIAFDLDTAPSLHEGMAHISTHQVDLVLMNLTLPDCNNGLDAVHTPCDHTRQRAHRPQYRRQRDGAA